MTDPANTPVVFDAAYADGSPGPHDGAWVVYYANGMADLIQPTTTATP